MAEIKMMLSALPRICGQLRELAEENNDGSRRCCFIIGGGDAPAGIAKVGCAIKTAKEIEEYPDNYLCAMILPLVRSHTPNVCIPILLISSDWKSRVATIYVYPYRTPAPDFCHCCGGCGHGAEVCPVRMAAGLKGAVVRQYQV